VSIGFILDATIMLSIKAGEGDYVTSLLISAISFFLVMKYDWPAPIIIIMGGALFYVKYSIFGSIESGNGFKEE
jgi:hypothetical protein